MPNMLNPAKRRITYTEFSDVFDEINKFALKTRSDRSSVLRQATQEFVLALKRKTWKPAEYAKPTDPNASIKRVSYAEWSDVSDVLFAFARDSRQDLSAVLRRAVHTYLENQKRR
jgi:hypothetical protein